jgi:hypothetical protein
MQVIICAPTLFALEVPVYLLKDGETEAKTIGYFQTAELDQALFTLAIAKDASTIIIKGDNEYNKTVAEKIRTRIENEYSTNKITVIVD